MPDIIVSDSSCLIALESIGRLDILKEVYGEIYIPEGVKEELGVEIPAWIKIIKVENKQLIKSLFVEIGLGEAEVIASGLEKKQSLLIIDDKKARNLALQLGLKITGTLAVLLKAKKKKVILSLKEIIDELENKNFRISDVLKEKALNSAKE